MTKAEALKLKVNDRVCWIPGGPEDLGTVVETTMACIRIRWDNLEVGYMHPSDMSMVGKVKV